MSEPTFSKKRGMGGDRTPNLRVHNGIAALGRYRRNLSTGALLGVCTLRQIHRLCVTVSHVLYSNHRRLYTRDCGLTPSLTPPLQQKQYNKDTRGLEAPKKTGLLHQNLYIKDEKYRSPVDSVFDCHRWLAHCGDTWLIFKEA